MLFKSKNKSIVHTKSIELSKETKSKDIRKKAKISRLIDDECEQKFLFYFSKESTKIFAVLTIE